MMPKRQAAKPRAAQPGGSGALGDQATDQQAPSDPHPCMQGTLGLHCSQGEMQQLPWLLQEQLEDHKATMVSLLKESNRLAKERASESLKLLHELMLQHRTEMIDHSEAMVLKIQRAQTSLEETLERFHQHRNSLSVLSGGKPQAGSDGVQFALQGGEGLVESLIAKLEARDEHRQEAMQRRMDELKSLMKSQGPHVQAARFGNGAAAPRGLPQGGGISTREELEEESGEDNPRLDSPPQMAGAGVGSIGADAAPESTTPGTIRLSKASAAAAGTLGSKASAATDGTRRSRLSFSSSSWSGNHRFGTVHTVLDMVSTAVILVNCAWMGVEADLTSQAVMAGQAVPDWTAWVEIAFAVFFVFEIGARLYLQRKHFFRRPQLGMNLFDMSVVFLLVVDVTFQLYNVSWLRSIRVLRVFNAARIIRSIDKFRQLRLLLSALASSWMQLVWVLMLMFFVLYLCAILLLQTTQAHITSVATLDPSLTKYYGSVGSCMLTLFMAITGGAPWESLLQPLADISVVFTGVYVLYVIFVLFGLMNIVTAIFVESTKVLAQKDNEMHVADVMRSKTSGVNKLRTVLVDVDAAQTGMISGDQLETELRDPEFTRRLKGLGMEVWEARGLFQLLDTDALGQVSIEEFLHGIARLKCKDQSVDLTTVMYENKRILTRLLAFMRFAEDHFRDMENLLGMPSSSARRAVSGNLDQYLTDATRRVLRPEKLGVLHRLT